MLSEWLGETSIVGMVLSGSLIAKLVLLILALMSALSWAVIIIKAIQYIHIRKENRKFYQIYLNESSLNQIKKVSVDSPYSPFALMFSETYQEAARMSQRIERSRSDITEKTSWQSKVFWLFIILFFLVPVPITGYVSFLIS